MVLDARSPENSSRVPTRQVGTRRPAHPPSNPDTTGRNPN
jgi:hypothetical protein